MLLSLTILLTLYGFVPQYPRVFIGTTLDGFAVVFKALYMDSMELWVFENLASDDSLCIVRVEALLPSPIGVYDDADVCLVCMPRLTPLKDAMRRGGFLRADTAVVGGLIAQLLRVRFMLLLAVVFNARTF